MHVLTLKCGKKCSVMFMFRNDDLSIDDGIQWNYVMHISYDDVAPHRRVL